MKNIFLLTSAAILLGTASFAAGKLDRIAATYSAQGYTNVQVTKSHGKVTVTADKDGVSSTFAAAHDAGKHTGKGKGKTKVKDGTVGAGDDDGTVVGGDTDTGDQVGADTDIEDQVGDDADTGDQVGDDTGTDTEDQVGADVSAGDEVGDADGTGDEVGDDSSGEDSDVGTDDGETD